MNPSDILQLVIDGELDPGEIEDFQALDEEFQEMVVSEEIELDEALEMN